MARCLLLFAPTALCFGRWAVLSPPLPHLSPATLPQSPHPPLPTFTLTPPPVPRSRFIRALAEDPYEVLGVQRGATAAQIKQAYRRLALRSHPDVNKAPDAQEKFATIAEAYSILSDPEKRRQHDARAGFGSTAGRSSPGTGASSYDDAASRARAAERARRWKEENPMPEDLGDSFGSLFSDFIGAVGKVVVGGDWMSLLEELQENDAGQLDAILRSFDVEMLKDELESARFVQAALKSRIERLTVEAKAAQAELDEWERNWRMRDLERPSSSSMGKTYGRQLEQDVDRRRSQLRDARNLLSQAESRESRIAQRLEAVRSGSARQGSEGWSGAGTGSSQNRERRLPSVEEELQRMKREMGK